MNIDPVDIGEFDRKHDILMYLPQLVQIFSALLLLIVVTMMSRLIIMDAGAVILSASGVAGGLEISIALLSITVTLFAVIMTMYIGLVQYYNAFYHLSPLRLVVSFFLIGLTISAFWSISSAGGMLELFANYWALGGIAFYGVSLLYLIGYKRTVLSDAVSSAISRARLGTAIGYLYRYNALNVPRTIINYAKYGLRLGFLFLALGIVSIVQSLIGIVAVPLALIAFVGMVIFMRPYIANGMFNAGRRFRRDSAQSASKLFEQDTRPPVIFLRSFVDDSVETERSRSFDEVIFGLRTQRIRLEELLVERAFGYGPVGALHDQRQKFQPLGAARDLTSHDDWQAHVVQWLKRAQRVVFVMGLSNGLSWEIETAVEMGVIHKFIVVFPPYWRGDYGQRAVASTLSKALSIDIHKFENPILIYFRNKESAVLVSAVNRSSSSYEYAAALAFESGSAKQD